MARAVRNAKIEMRSNRARLPGRREPNWTDGLRASVDELAAENKMSRSEAIRALIEQGLKKWSHYRPADDFREGLLSEAIKPLGRH